MKLLTLDCYIDPQSIKALIPLHTGDYLLRLDCGSDIVIPTDTAKRLLSGISEYSI